MGMNALVIGGTRNLGPGIVAALREHGYRVSVLHRGQTPAALPADVEELFADRTQAAELRQATRERSFDVVVDTTLYNGREAREAVEIFSGRIGRYIFLSTGQVYLVRVGAQRPFREDAYDGPVMPEPPPADDFNHRNWLYGDGKRAAEDVFRATAGAFPFTSLRLPMVNSRRDHYARLHNYLARLWDGGPLLLADGPELPVRHVYGDDVVAAILRAIALPAAAGQAYNIGQDDAYSVPTFLALLAAEAGVVPRLVRVPRAELDARGLLPACSPFSDPWMSALDNTSSKRELGMRYTPAPDYLRVLVEHYRALPPPAGYAQRGAELELAAR